MAMTKGTKMMAINRMTQGNRTQNQNQSEYGGGSGRRMIGYDREMNGQANGYGVEPGRDEMNYRAYGAESRMRSYSEGGMQNNGYGMGEGSYSGMNGSYGTEARRRRDSRGRYMMGGMDMGDEEEPRGYQRRAHGGNSFGDIYADVYAPGAQNRPNGMQGGRKHHQDDMDEPVDEQTARRWVRQMDGGEKFKVETAEQFRANHCPDCEKWEFYVAINMMYSDYCNTAKEMNVNRPEFYAMMARDFLCDKDAGENKLRKYMETIPE